MRENKKFGEWLQFYRERAGLTKSDLGDKANVTGEYVWALESSNKTAPKFDKCKLMFEALNLSEKEKMEMYKIAFEERVSQKDFDFLANGLKIIFDPKDERM